MSSSIALVELLRLDGILVPEGDWAERKIICFNPNHTALEPTMTINIASGTYRCPCSIEGTALSYLTRIKKMDEELAFEKLKALGWSDDRIEHARLIEKKKERDRAGLPKLFNEIPEQISKMKRVRLHDYSRVDGETLCSMAVYQRSDGGEKKFPFTPASRGGWWMCEPMNQALPPEDLHMDKFPLYRLFGLKNELVDPRRQVWIVHDEATADTVASLRADPNKVLGPADGHPPVTCIFGNKRAIRKIDMRMLYGRMVLLLANMNEETASYMRRVGLFLHDKGCAVKYFLPGGDSGFGIREVLAQDGWADALKWIQGIGTMVHDSENPLFQDPRLTYRPDHAPVLAPPMERTDHFRVLGIHDEHVVFQLHKTGQIYYCRDTGVGNTGVLQKLAPLSFWISESDQEGLSTKNRMKFADALLRAAQSKGMYNPATNSHGRGAGRFEDGKAFYHLGDRLLLENEETSLLDVESGFDVVDDQVFLPRARIAIKDSHKGREYLRDACKAIMRYRFQSNHHARAFMGFMVTCLIGGLLEFRPMMWLIAREDAGKTFLLNRFMKPLLGETLTPAGDATEAGLADEMRDDSLPVYIDEFEPGSGRTGADRFNGVLKSIRLASSGEARRIRFGMTGGVPNITPRYSMMVSSIDRPRLSNADFGRFFMCRLSLTPVKEEEWPEIRDEIIQSVTGERGRMIRACIIQNAVRIAKSVREIEDKLAPSFKKQRDLQLISALTAAAGFASGDYETISRSLTDVDNTTLTPLELVLGSMVPIKGAQRMALLECLSLSTWGRWEELDGKHTRHEDDMYLDGVAARYGLKICYDRLKSHGIELYIALGMKNMAELLRNTEAENIDLDNYLLTMPGAEIPKIGTTDRRKRIRFSGAQRNVVRVSNDTLREMGFIPDNAPDDPRAGQMNISAFGQKDDR